MIVGSKYLSRMSKGHHVPATALIVMGAIPAAIALSALWLQDAIATIISFAAVGIYISFQMIVLAALIARGKGWRPAGPFTLGAWGLPVNVLALAYGVGAIVNIVWPRSPNDPWYVDYAMLVTTLGILVLGSIYMAAAKPYEHGLAPAGDAHRLAAGKAGFRVGSRAAPLRRRGGSADRHGCRIPLIGRRSRCCRRRSNWRSARM